MEDGRVGPGPRGDQDEVAVVFVAADGVVVGWSAGAAARFGYTSAEVEGRPVAATILRDEPDGAGPARFHPPPAARRRETVPLRHRDGQTVMVPVTVEPIVLGSAPHTLVVAHRSFAAEAVDVLPARDVLQILFERAPEIITITDVHGNQKTVNGAGLAQLGFDARQRRPYDGWSFIHPDDVDRMVAYRRDLGPGHLAPPFRYRVRDAGGDWRWLESVVADLTDVPEVAGRVAFSRDVTEAEERAQALLESQSRLHALISGFRGGAFLDDAEGTVILANQRLSAYFAMGATAEHLIGRRRDELLGSIAESALDRAGFLALAEPEALEGVGSVEVELADGRTVEMEVTPIAEAGTLLGHLWLFHDATERRRTERRQARLLELEQGARRDAELQSERLRAFDQLRNDFVDRVSHELRTPLASIAGSSELLLGADEVGDPLLRRHLEIIGRNADRLRSMIEDLLLVGRLDAGMLHLDVEPLDVAETLADVVLDLEPVARARDVRLEVGEVAPGELVADRGRVLQVLGNLVTNGIKFTEPGTEVVLAAAHRDGAWRLSVADHGPGIPEDERDTVFDRFRRSAGADRDGTPGAGLGLSIVKGLVELHLGTVEIGDRPGGGTVVTCAFPDRA